MHDSEAIIQLCSRFSELMLEVICGFFEKYFKLKSLLVEEIYRLFLEVVLIELREVFFLFQMGHDRSSSFFLPCELTHRNS